MPDLYIYYLIGAGSAVLALVMTFMMPVSQHRVNQHLITILIAIFFFVAAFCIFDPPLSILAGIVATGIALLYRDIVRWVKEFMWHNVTRYTHRYYWYNKVGRAVMGGDGRGRRRREE
ncbi:MAG: hypothetical protein WCF84_19755 [Anaerolineae bacterium]